MRPQPARAAVRLSEMVSSLLLAVNVPSALRPGRLRCTVTGCSFVEWPAKAGWAASTAGGGRQAPPQRHAARSPELHTVRWRTITARRLGREGCQGADIMGRPARDAHGLMGE